MHHRVLVLFAHPALEKSRVHRRLVEAVPDEPGITVHDLYESYPRLDIDVEREQELLETHDVVVLQFPFYWYSTPPILKQWQDLVLEHGWAYGSRGTALQDKVLLCAVSTGGGSKAYRPEGHNRFTVRQLLAPVEQTAYLCGMRFLPPWIVYGTHGLGVDAIRRRAREYGDLLRRLRDGDLLDGDTDLAGMDDLNTVAAGFDRTPTGGGGE